MSPVHFAGKERDWSNLSPTNLDNFGARYYSSNMARFMSPDWAAKPTAVPYASFGNPQSLNLYTYVKNNPTTTRDPDGHCCDMGDVWNVIDFAMGVANAYGSDNLAGAGRVSQDTTAGRMGAAFGDAGAMATGSLEFLGGLGGEAGGGALDSTGVGAIVGVPANVASAGLIVHGGTTAAEGAGNLGKNLSSAMESRRPSSDVRAKADQKATGEDGKTRCSYCGKEVTNEPGHSNSKEYDHVDPWVKSHDSSKKNIDVACRTRNRQKGPRTPDEWKKNGQQ